MMIYFMNICALFVLDTKGDFSVEFKKTQNGPFKIFKAFFLLIILWHS